MFLHILYALALAVMYAVFLVPARRLTTARVELVALEPGQILNPDGKPILHRDGKPIAGHCARLVIVRGGK